MKINVDLMNALQEAEEIKIKKTVLMEGANIEVIEETCAKEPIKEDQIEDAREDSREKGLCEEPAEDATPAEALQKSELTEDADSDILNKLHNGETVYFREESGDPVAITLTNDYTAPEEYDQGLQGEELEKAQQAAANGEVWKAEHIEENDIEMPVDVAAILYGEDELKTYLSGLRHVNVISTLEEIAKPAEEPKMSYTFELSLPGCQPLKFDDNWSVDAAKKEYLNNEGADTDYTLDDIKVTRCEETVQEAAPIDNTSAEDKTSKEERLASLKTQLEQDGDQLADDEKESIEKEIADLEAEIYPIENKTNESVTIDEIEGITQRIEAAEDMDEIQQIIYTISDGVLENEVQLTFDGCNEDDDLDEVKSLVLTTLEDNAEYIDEQESLKPAEEPVEEAADNKICEAETKGLKISQNQGNIFMLEDENKKIYVGENYNEAEKILENAEIYESLEEAEKDYLSRCGLNIED